MDLKVTAVCSGSSGLDQISAWGNVTKTLSRATPWQERRELHQMFGSASMPLLVTMETGGTFSAKPLWTLTSGWEQRQTPFRNWMKEFPDIQRVFLPSCLNWARGGWGHNISRATGIKPKSSYMTYLNQETSWMLTVMIVKQKIYCKVESSQPGQAPPLLVI